MAHLMVDPPTYTTPRDTILSGGGATHVVYDRLLTGHPVTELMHHGLIPVVAMKQARTDSSFISLPAELQRVGYAKKKGAPEVKSRLAYHWLDTVEHDGAGGTCAHDLWALDGSVVSVEPGAEVTLDATYVPCVALERGVDTDGNCTLTGIYSVPCRHGSIRTRVELSGTRPGQNVNGREPVMSDWLRPIPESSDAFAALSGMRSDVESGFAHLKSRLPKQKASSLVPEHFMLDIVGAALAVNAVLWDVHVAGHTDCARDVRRLAARRALHA